MPERLSDAAKARQEAIEDHRFDINLSRKLLKPGVGAAATILMGNASISLVEAITTHQGFSPINKVSLLAGIGTIGLKPLWKAVSRRETEATEHLHALEEAPTVAAKVVEIATQPQPDEQEAELLPPEWVSRQPIPDPLPNVA